MTLSTLSNVSICLFSCLTFACATKHAPSSTATSPAGLSVQQLESDTGNDVPRYYHLSEQGRQALDNHDAAFTILDPLFMRDPYILLGPDNYYYLTGTRLANIYGGGKQDYKNEGVEIWRSENLADWELLGVPYRLDDLGWADHLKEKLMRKKGNHNSPLLWAPELHYFDKTWYITHTTNAQQAVIVSSKNLMGPYQETTTPKGLGHRHDPTLMRDQDGQNYLLYRACEIVKMNDNFSQLEGQPLSVAPSDRKIGHEGCYIIPYQGKYVMLGTAWSTDKMRHGTYNMYYATADNITGPYNERKWMGRFLGHGSPFQDKQGRWWMTAFRNGTPIEHAELAARETQDDIAYTINPNGATFVPFEMYLDEQGEVRFTIKDHRYAKPGPEEVQQF